MRTVVFIMGSGHCGSTLLDLMLGSHSDAFSLGEIHRIGGPVDARARDSSARICGVCPERCEFWDERVPPFWMRLFYSRRNLITSALRKLAHYVFNPYAFIMRWSGKNLVIDSSKGTAWIDRQLSPAYKWHGIRPVLIYLHRDGRAVVSSYLRKYPERGFEAIVESWKRGAERMENYFDAFHQGPKFRVSYESLTSDPEATMQSICRSLHIDYEPDMLRYWRHDHHHVFGNGGTRNLIYRYRMQFEAPDDALRQRMEDAKQHYSHEYYDQVEVAIQPDERWRNELSAEQLERFDLIAGPANRAYAAPRRLGPIVPCRGQAASNASYAASKPPLQNQPKQAGDA